MALTLKLYLSGLISTKLIVVPVEVRVVYTVGVLVEA